MMIIYNNKKKSSCLGGNAADGNPYSAKPKPIFILTEENKIDPGAHARPALYIISLTQRI